MEDSKKITMREPSPYSRPRTTTRAADKFGVIWKDFVGGFQKRKKMMEKLREASINDGGNKTMLVRLMLEIRQITLRIVEDGLEIEYRNQIESSASKHHPRLALVPIAGFQTVEQSDHLKNLVEIITDVDKFLEIPSLSSVFPSSFPKRRNPFLLGQSVDDLVSLKAPQPTPGIVEEELKVLEMLRYKRGAKALLRAEAQLSNKFPISLYDIDAMWLQMVTNTIANKLARVALTLLENDGSTFPQTPMMDYVLGRNIDIEPHDFLVKLNCFRGDRPMRMDVIAAVRQVLVNSSPGSSHSIATAYINEWVHSVLNIPPSRENYPPSMVQLISTKRLELRPMKQESLASIVGSTDKDGMKDFELERKPQTLMKVLHGVKSIKTMEVQRLVDRSNQSSIADVSSEIERRVKEEVARVLNDQCDMATKSGFSIHSKGNIRSLKKQDGSNKRQLVDQKTSDQPEPPSGVGGNVDFETLSSVRYELLKIQQELIRRKVMDPRHYTALSVDMLNMQARGLTTVAESEIHHKEHLEHAAEQARYVPLCFKDFERPSGAQMQLQVVLDLMNDVVIVRLIRFFSDIDGSDIGTRGSVVAENVLNEMISFMKLSKLILHRICGRTLPELMDASIQSRLEILEMLLNSVIASAMQPTMPNGRLPLHCDRTLHKTSIAANGIAADVTISRNDDCDALIIVCSPISGSNIRCVDNGPITMTITDKEIQVLLVNQREMFEMAKLKWESMQQVAMWLASRLIVRRIKVFDEDFGSAVKRVGAHKSSKIALPSQEMLHRGLDEVPALICHTDSLDSDDENDVIKRRRKEIKSQKGVDVPKCLATISSGAQNLSHANILVGNLSGKGLSKPTTTMLLDVQLNREIDVERKIVNQWKNRNVPCITGTKVQMKMHQDLELLRFEIKLLIPHPRLFELRRTQKKTTRDGLIDFSRINEDEEDVAGAMEIDSSLYTPIVVSLEYQLAVADVAIFGTAESQGGKNVTLSMASGADHPSTFMWNIINRLSVQFKGSLIEPYTSDFNAEDSTNWLLVFDRRLLRDVRTISGGVVTVAASAVGNELLFCVEPTDGSIFSKIGAKLLTDAEIREFVYGESWPLSLLHSEQRVHLATRILDKLKVVNEKAMYRLELYNYVETGMIEVALHLPGVRRKADALLGMIEINSHHTLYDVRTIIRHELDQDIVPFNYKFLYKGAPCSERQESFRTAFECMPRVIIIPKVIKADDDLMLTEEQRREAEARAKEEAEKLEKLKPIEVKLSKGQRRVNKKLVPVPVPTLCIMQEGSEEVHLLHDFRKFFAVGDVVRIGDPEGRDYIVSMRSRLLMTKYPKTMKIDPFFDLTLEGNFNPCRSHMPFPTNARFLDGQKLLPSVRDLDFRFTIPKKEKFNDDGEDLHVEDGDHSIIASKPATERERGSMWTEIWIWKCIPPSEDNRPRWRRLYDDGRVKYNYDYDDSDACITYFRARAPMRLLEVLCTDCRIPEMAQYPQRVDELHKWTVEKFTTFVYGVMLDWFPQFKRGIDGGKFQKLMKESRIFPDIKKPARVQQIELMFQKEARSANGVVDKYVNYAGFCRLLKEISVIRFPPKTPGTDSKIAQDDGASFTDISAVDVSGDDDDSQEDCKDSKKIKAKQSDVKLLQKMVNRQASFENFEKNFLRQKATADEDAPKSTDHARRQSTVSLANSAASSVGSTGGRNNRTKKKYNNGAMLVGGVLVEANYLVVVFTKLVNDFIVLHPAWFNNIWNDCKLAVMKKEALRYCAATRIAAKFRGGRWHHRYRFMVQHLSKFQAVARSFLVKRRIKAVKNMLIEDWLFRLRYHSATKITSIVRRYLKRCAIIKVFKKRKVQEVGLQKARRFRMKKMRAHDRKAIVLKEIRRISGTLVTVTVKRKDPRSYSQDYGMIVQIYVPTHSVLAEFTLEEGILRDYMMLELGMDSLSLGDILDKRNLRNVVTSRLIIHTFKQKHRPPKLFFSKQSLSERGGKKMTLGKIIDKELFVCKLFETGSDVSVQCYHRFSCKVFRCTIDVVSLRDWVVKSTTPHDDDVVYEDPPILLPKNKKTLYKWAIDRIVIDKRKGKFRPMFSCQLERSKKLEGIVKIQSAVRRMLVWPKLLRLLDSYLLKVQSSATEPDNCYYLNVRNGTSSWDKPSLLGTRELITQPSYRWVPFMYSHDGGLYQHFVNPLSGKYTHLTIERAATIIQRLVRHHLLKTLQISLEEVTKVINVRRSAYKTFDLDPKRLASVINYALIAFCLEHDHTLAASLFQKALVLSETNALVTRSFAIFLIATGEMPVKPTRKRAMKYIHEAEQRDLSASKFAKAMSYFRFACLNSPRDILALTNLALMECLICKNNQRAEILFRRALAIAPFDDRLVDIWNFIKKRFAEKHLAYVPLSHIEVPKTRKGAKKRVRHGRPCIEDPTWAGWVFIEDDPYFISRKFRDGHYWYNPADGTEQQQEPDFRATWRTRMDRSIFKEKTHELHIFYDPITASHFQYHPLTMTFM